MPIFFDAYYVFLMGIPGYCPSTVPWDALCSFRCWYLWHFLQNKQWKVNNPFRIIQPLDHRIWGRAVLSPVTPFLRWGHDIIYTPEDWHNLKITLFKRKIIFQASIFGFHANFPGCHTPFFHWLILCIQGTDCANLQESTSWIAATEREILSTYKNHLFQHKCLVAATKQLWKEIFEIGPDLSWSLTF